MLIILITDITGTILITATIQYPIQKKTKQTHWKTIPTVNWTGKEKQQNLTL